MKNMLKSVLTLLAITASFSSAECWSPDSSAIKKANTAYKSGESIRACVVDGAMANSHYITATSLYDLNVKGFGYEKDTKMLDVDLGELADQYGWNLIHTNTVNPYPNDYVTSMLRGRCWAISAYNLYTYYNGGNRHSVTSAGVSVNKVSNALTQDEMVFIGKTYNSKDSVEGIFGFQAGGSDAQMKHLLETILYNSADTSASVSIESSLSISTVESSLKNGMPLYVGLALGGNLSMLHQVLIDGVAKDSQGKKLVHLVNIDNGGATAYAYLDSLMVVSNFRYTKPVKSHLKKTNTNCKVDKDRDGDGIVDFDECYRFHTDPDTNDTDGDLFSDYTEIYNYTRLTNLTYASKKKIYYYKPSFLQSGYRPELDPKNQYGFEYAYPKDVPGDFTVYADSNLIINANTKIMTGGGKGGGSVACRGKINNVALTINKGVKLAKVYSRSKVVINNDVSNPVSIQNLIMHKIKSTDGSEDVIINNKTSALDFMTVYPTANAWRWNHAKLTESKVFSATRNRAYTIDSSKTYTLSHSDSSKSVRSRIVINKGGTLVLDTGDLYVKSLVMNSGSILKLRDSSYSTVLHVDSVENWKVLTNNVMATKFKMMQYGKNTISIYGAWKGVLFAPNGNIVIGGNRSVYGKFLAKNVTIYSNFNVYKNNFIEKHATLNKSADMPQREDNEVDPSVATFTGGIKILQAGSNMIRFESPSASSAEIVVTAVNGKQIARKLVNASIGENEVNFDFGSLSRGFYVVLVKQGHSKASHVMKID